MHPFDSNLPICSHSIYGETIHVMRMCQAMGGFGIVEWEKMNRHNTDGDMKTYKEEIIDNYYIGQDSENKEEEKRDREKKHLLRES